MNLSIAEEFLRFKKLFNINTVSNKESILDLNNKFFKNNQEIKSLENKVYALTYKIKGLQDQILILEEKFLNLNEKNQDAAIRQLLEKLDKNIVGKFIEKGGTSTNGKS